MARTKETTVYKFDELEDAAKEKARAWFRERQLDYDWYDSVYEDAQQIGEILGIEFDTKRRRNNPKSPAEPCIWFSGFSSQGDGACFEGRYSFKADASTKIREYAPKDSTLHAIADGLTAIQAENGNALEVRVKHRGHYYHKFCTEIDVDLADTRADDSEDMREMSEGADELVKELLRDFMEWIYRTLEKECEWLQADEQVDESIRANEYEFEADGSIA